MGASALRRLPRGLGVRQPSGALAGRVSSKFVGKAAENCRTPRSWCATLAFFVLLALAVRPAVAHTASLTRVDALLTTNSLTLTFQLNQPDLLQFLHARTNDAVIQMTEAEVRTLAPRIADYVQSRTRFALDTNAPARGTLSNWPPAPLTLTLEERPGEPRPAPLPLTFRWEIPPTAKQLELSLSLFDTVGFAALFEVLFHRGQGIPPVLQFVQSRQAMVIDLDAFQEDTRSTASTQARRQIGGDLVLARAVKVAEFGIWNKLHAGKFLFYVFTYQWIDCFATEEHVPYFTDSLTIQIVVPWCSV